MSFLILILTFTVIPIAFGLVGLAKLAFELVASYTALRILCLMLLPLIFVDAAKSAFTALKLGLYDIALINFVAALAYFAFIVALEKSKDRSNNR